MITRMTDLDRIVRVRGVGDSELGGDDTGVERLEQNEEYCMSPAL